MAHRTRILSVGLSVLCLLVWCGRAWAQTAAKPIAKGVVVLDTTGFWRMHRTLKPPVVRTEGGLKPLLLKAEWVDRQTPPPPADWMKPGFDDHRWLRGPARLGGSIPYLARLCLRGKFTVTDPAKVRGLKLVLAYHGGAVVYVNGRQVARADMAPGPAGLGEDYPAEAFSTKNGSLLMFEAARRTVRAGDPRLGMINRATDVAIPRRLLQSGVNVVAVEIVRAAYPRIVDDKRNPKKRYWNFAWDTCQIDHVRLTADSADGLVPNSVRPKGMQVWNSNLLAADYDLDFGDRTEKLHPIKIVGVRNGCFSGKVVVGASTSILRIKAVAGDLKGPGGVIPAAQIKIRYGLPWGRDAMVIPYGGYPYPVQADLLGCLSEKAPDVIPVRRNKAKLRAKSVPGQPAPVYGAVAPIWVTVSVPKDTAPGTYKGRIAIQAEGRTQIAVPVELKVGDWTLPDSQDYRTGIEIIQSPDTLAEEYNVPLWSDRHWELITESFKLLRDSGNRIVYVPLIAETNFGHGQSMVRWIDKGSSRYEYDFSVMDKYLDLAAKHMGKPKTVVFYVWDVYMLDSGGGGTGASQGGQKRLMKGLEDRGVLLSRGPMVTTLVKAPSKTRNVVLPKYTDPASKALWAPLFEQLRRRMVQRGLDKAMMLGMITDAWPTKQEVAFLAEVAPGLPWVVHAHFCGPRTVYKLADVGYQVRVWGIKPPGSKSLMGWKQPARINRYFRQRNFDGYPASTWRYMCEFAITGNQRGVGRLGGEFWRVIRDKQGQRKGRIYERYPHSNWRNLDIYTSLLAPGPNGPAATHHYQHLIEGIQECEARIVVGRALSDKAIRAGLADDLVKRCQELLDERMRCAQVCFSRLMNRLDGNPAGLSSTGKAGVAPHYWCIVSGWEERAEKLFALAEEVQKKARVLRPPAKVK